VTPAQPSRTSIVVAALRAFGAREPDKMVRNPDALVERLIGPAELQLISEHPVARALHDEYQKSRRQREVAGMSNLILIRTRFIDEGLVQALSDGATQVVILGAGFDTRAYRFVDLLKDKKVIEVDHRSTQEIKKQRLTAASIPIPPNVRFAEIDFKTDVLTDVLVRAGYDPSAKTFFIWEGVSYYLTESAVRDTLRTISQGSVAGSSLVMDFAGAALIEMLRKYPTLSQHKYTTNWGEPWTFGLPDTRESEFFKECGLDVLEIMNFFGPQASKRYLTRSDGASFGNARGSGPSQRAFTTMLGVIWMFLTRRSRWMALARLEVPHRT
jgi:methyltransferase (TIGR00027 family)